MNCVENLMRQRHDRDQSESQECITVDSCFGLFSPRQYSIMPQRTNCAANASQLCVGRVGDWVQQLSLARGSWVPLDGHIFLELKKISQFQYEKHEKNWSTYCFVCFKIPEGMKLWGVKSLIFPWGSMPPVH